MGRREGGRGGAEGEGEANDIHTLRRLMRCAPAAWGSRSLSVKSFPRQRRQVKLMTEASGAVPGSVIVCWLWVGMGEGEAGWGGLL